MAFVSILGRYGAPCDKSRLSNGYRGGAKNQVNRIVASLQTFPLCGCIADKKKRTATPIIRHPSKRALRRRRQRF